MGIYWTVSHTIVENRQVVSECARLDSQDGDRCWQFRPCTVAVGRTDSARRRWGGCCPSCTSPASSAHNFAASCAHPARMSAKATAKWMIGRRSRFMRCEACFILPKCLEAFAGRLIDISPSCIYNGINFIAWIFSAMRRFFLCMGNRESGASPERSGHCERGMRL